MSPVFADHPLVWKAIYSVVLCGTRSTFSSLEMLASLRLEKTGKYDRSDLSNQFGGDLIHRALTQLHIELLGMWLSTPIENQRREVDDYLRAAGIQLDSVSGAVAQTLSNWLPLSATPAERFLFETDLGHILRVLRAERTPEISGGPAIQNRDHWAVAACLRTIKDRGGDIHLTLRKLSRELGVSANYLGRTFRQYTGVRFREYARGVRIHKAATLAASSFSICQIAEALGYGDDHNFRRDFCKVMGRSPVMYRREKIGELAV